MSVVTKKSKTEASGVGAHLQHRPDMRSTPEKEK